MRSPLAPTGRTVHTTAADGTIRDWLVTEAWSLPADDLERFLDPNGDPWGPVRFSDGLPTADQGRWVLTQGPDAGPLKERILKAHTPNLAQRLPDVREDAPVAWEVFGTRFEGAFKRRHTGWDGMVDWSAFCFTPEYRAAVAATAIEIDQAEWRTIEISSTGPYAFWIDGQLVHSSTSVSYMEPSTHSLQLRLHSRLTTFHVATWQVAFREVRHIVRVRVTGLPVRVVIPSPGADETVARLAETFLAGVGNPSWAQEGDQAELIAPADVNFTVQVADSPAQHLRSDADGRLRYSLVGAPQDETDEDESGSSTAASILSSGESLVRVRLDDPRSPLAAEFHVAALPTTSTETSEGDAESWRSDVLSHIAAWDEAGPASTARLLARYAADPRTRVRRADLESARHRVRTRGDCADFEIIALLFVWHRIPAANWDEGLHDEVRSDLTHMKYWITQPGLDAMCYFTENHQLVWHIAQTLAGEAFAEEVFSVDGRIGRSHADEGRARTAGWISRKLAGGFSEFDSNAYLAIDTYALVALVELGEDPLIRTAASILIDQILVSLASNSWRGIHGAAHGRSYVQTLRSARYEETSPLLRLIAGVGTLNDAVLPVTALALAKRYVIPDVVRELARTQSEEWWGRQVYRGELTFERDLLQRPYRSDVRVWRTPGVMLASVQDYRSGLPGLQEHLWGATLGREAQVFVTHPSNADTGSSARPNAWVGHRVLGRVHQHRNVAVHLQRFTPTDPRAETHLWLPSAQFAELHQLDDWVFARRGNGYLAIATPGGVAPVRTGDTAYQEWRPRSGGAVWIAVVGDAVTEGPFEAWSSDLAAASLDWNLDGVDSSGVIFDGARWPRIEASYEGPFLVNGRPEGIVNGQVETEPRFDNPAFRLEFGQDAALISWHGVEYLLQIGKGLQAASEVITRDGR